MINEDSQKSELKLDFKGGVISTTAADKLKGKHYKDNHAPLKKNLSKK